MKEIIEELVNWILSIIAMIVFIIMFGMIATTISNFNNPTEQEICSELVRGLNQHTLTNNDDMIITWDSIEGKQIARQCRVYIK